ncbi:MAG: hypothetical protein R2717_04140 [Schumannella sp.]
MAENAWAFLPGYPLVMWVVTLGHHLPFPALAPLVSTAFAAGAALLFYRLMARRLPGSNAMFAVVLFCVAPLSPILQVSYAESMALFLLFGALILLLDRRYLLLIPVAVAMALTRPSGLAFALLLLLHLIHRLATRRRDVFPPREFARVCAAGLAIALAGVLWPLVAWAVTGVPTAYTDTELVWRRAYIGEQELVPFTSWFQGAHWWLGWWGVPEALTWPLAIAGVLVLVAGFAAFLLCPGRAGSAWTCACGWRAMRSTCSRSSSRSRAPSACWCPWRPVWARSRCRNPGSGVCCSSCWGSPGRWPGSTSRGGWTGRTSLRRNPPVAVRPPPVPAPVPARILPTSGDAG